MSVVNALPFARRTRPLFDLAAYCLILILAIWLTYQGSVRLGYNWQWYMVPRYLFSFEGGFTVGPLLTGLWLTIKIAAAALLLSFVFGLGTALLRLSPSLTGRFLARGYLEVIRNTPLLIQIFFIYFVISPVVGIERFWAGVLALSLFEGAYASEIIRAGILSIHTGQWEAAHSLGLSARHTYARVILPQTARRILPPMTSQAVALIKDSALLSTISVFELTMEGQLVIADTFLTFEIWFTVAAMYLAVTVALSFTAQGLEKRMRAGD